MIMKSFDLGSVELTLNSGRKLVELCVMEVIESRHGTYLTGYNHTSNMGFIHQVTSSGENNAAPQVPEMVDANFSAARRNMTPDVLARIMTDAGLERIELNGNVDRIKFVGDLLNGYEKSHREGASASYALLEQYGPISNNPHDDVLRYTFEEIHKKLQKLYPDGPEKPLGTSRFTNDGAFTVHL